MQSSLPGKHRAKEPRPCDQIIILHLFPVKASYRLICFGFCFVLVNLDKIVHKT